MELKETFITFDLVILSSILRRTKQLIRKGLTLLHLLRINDLGKFSNRLNFLELNVCVTKGKQPVDGKMRKKGVKKLGSNVERSTISTTGIKSAVFFWSIPLRYRISIAICPADRQAILYRLQFTFTKRYVSASC